MDKLEVGTRRQYALCTMNILVESIRKTLKFIAHF